MREIANLSLADLRTLVDLQLDLFGDEVFVGCCDISEDGDWGVLACTLERVGAFIPIPTSEFAPGMDGYVNTRAVLRESLMVVCGEASAHAPERTFVGVYDRALRDWRVFRRDAACSPVAVGHAPGSSHAIHLNENAATAEFELIDLSGSRTVGRIPARQPSTAECLAMNLSLTHVAVAGKDEVVCAGLDGEVERTWPKAERFFSLWFAEDDVVGVSRDAFVVHLRKGGVERFELSNMRPRAIDPARRAGFFWDLKSGQYVELDLSTGRQLSAGTVPGDSFGVDLKTRRIAAWTEQQRLLRVYELPP